MERRAGGFGQFVPQRGPARCQRAALGDAGLAGLQAFDGRAHQRRQLTHRIDGFSAGAVAGDQQAAHPGFGRGQHRGDGRHFRHRESAVHGVNRAQQGLVGIGGSGSGRFQPAVDHGEVSGDFGVEDFQQELIDLGRNHLRQRSRRFTGLNGLDCFDFGFGLNRARPGRVNRLIGLRRRNGFPGGRGAQRGLRHGLVACRDALGIGLQGRKVDLDAVLALQRRQQAGQRVEGVVDHGKHGRRGRAAAVEHAVEQALDLPAELAQGAGADQAAAALEGVEHAADRAQALQILGRIAPRRQQGVEVVDFFGELFQEDFADLVVDLVAGGFEAAAGTDLDRRRGRGRNRRVRLAGFGVGTARGVGRRLAAILERGNRGRGVGFLGHHVRRCHVIRFELYRLFRQRPVAQGFQAVAGDVEDVLAVAAMLAQRFQVVLEAGQGVGEGVELAAIGHPAAAEQLGLGEPAHPGQEVRRLLQIQHAQGTGDFAQQPRHLDQLAVIPAGLHERHERLAGIGEVGDRLAGDDLDGLARFAGQRILLVVGAARAQPGNLFIQRCVHVQQRAGDIQQRVLAGGAVAAHDRVHRVALVEHHRTRHAKAEHAERVGHLVEHFDLRLQPGRAARAGAQVQVERILDPQQVFLHRRRNGVQQRAIAAAQAAAGMGDFVLAGRGLLKLEGRAQLAQRGMVAVAAGDVEQHLAGRLQRQLRACERVLSARVAPGLANHAGKRLAQAGTGLDRAVGDRLHHPLGDPQHPPHGFVTGTRKPGLDGGRESGRIRGRAALGPRPHPLRQIPGPVCASFGCIVGIGLGDAVGNRPLQIRGEQHAFAQPGRTARRAQLVEQRHEHDRDVLVPALQPLQVVGQQHRAAHQRGAGGVAIGHLVVLQRLGQALHFLGHHRRRIQLDHAQGALHLVQVAGAEAHPAGIGRILDEGLDLKPRLGQGLVELRLDPAQRGVVDRVAKRHRHRAPPCGCARAALHWLPIRVMSFPVSAVRPAA